MGSKAGFLQEGGRSGGWREFLDAAQVRRMVAANGPVMRRFGYIDEAGEPINS